MSVKAMSEPQLSWQPEKPESRLARTAQDRHPGSSRMDGGGVADSAGTGVGHSFGALAGDAPADAKVVGRGGDRFERAAERMAERVVQAPDLLATESGKADAPVPLPLPGRRSSSLSGSSGQPLDDSSRQRMEPRFGHLFDHVRLHTDTAAARMNDDLQARAFTHGAHIYFQQGHYDPGTRAGQGLLAHELTHVVQQANHPASTPAIQRSAVAHFDKASFEDRAEARRRKFLSSMRSEDYYEDNPLANLFHKPIRRGKVRRFEERIDLLDPAKFAARQAEVRKQYGGNKKKRDRKLAKLTKKQDNAKKNLGPLPLLNRVLVIAATYHYVPVTVINGQTYRFSVSALGEVAKKFRVGRSWPGLKWDRNGTNETISVRFDIKFQAHNNAASVTSAAGKPGQIAMRAKNLAAGPSQVTLDYSANPDDLKNPVRTVVSGNGGSHLADSNDSSIRIDTEAVRQSSRTFKYFEHKSDFEAGQLANLKTFQPQGSVLDKYMASTIAHEIGHNIGMIHDDRGVMLGQLIHTEMSSDKSPRKEGTREFTDTDYKPEVTFPDNQITPENVQALINRIPEMTRLQSLYWKEKKKTQKFADPPQGSSGFTSQ